MPPRIAPGARGNGVNPQTALGPARYEVIQRDKEALF